MNQPLDETNYHHLFYFWNIVREGSILGASRKLRVSQPTISEQLRALERSLDEKLFDRVGKKLVLSEVGRVLFRYADQIFMLGHEMRDAIKGRPTGRPLKLVVGVTEGMPKLIVYRLIEPALRMPDGPEIVCYEDPLERLVGDLTSNALDLVLSDSVAEAPSSVPIYSHLLGESGMALFAKKEVAVRLRPWFPRSLDGARMLLPTPNTSLRRSIDHWLHDLGVRPKVVGEFQDAGLLARFGEQGVGVFPAASAVEEDMRTHHRVEVVGRIDGVRQSFYALSVERKLDHPAVVLLAHTARRELFRS